MALKTLKELRENLASTVRESQISSLIDSYINFTLGEIHRFHPWTWLRRKSTFNTVASQEDYNLDEEVDRIGFLRQLTTDEIIHHVPDRLFYHLIPNPEDLSTGTPRYYRLWEETGFATNLAAADTIQVLSSSSSDGSAFKVVIVGRESTNNLIVSEEITLNGTTAVTSNTTWAASGLMQCSKSAKTTGTITVRRTTGSTALARLSPEETAPRYKRLSFYPIPNAAITVYLEYYERLRLLVNDADVPQLDHQWLWVVREGALEKLWEYKQNDTAALMHYKVFQSGLLAMRQQDDANLDYVPVIRGRVRPSGIQVRLQSDSSGGSFPQYAVGYR